MSASDPAATAAPARQVREFVRAARTARRIQGLGRGALLAGLPAAVALLLVGTAQPTLVLPLLPWFGGIVVLGAAIGLLAGHLAPARDLVRGLRPQPGVLPAVLQDELTTWFEQERRGALDTPVGAWLGATLAGELGRVPATAVRGLGRRRLGRLRYLLPLCVVLLLAWLLRFWAPPVPGFGGAVPEPTRGVPRPGGNAGGGAGGELPSPPQGGSPEQPQPPPDQPPAQPDPSRPEDEPTPPEPPQPPAPVPALPEYVLPEFTDQGPSRRELALAAQVAIDGGTAPQPPSAGPDAPPPVAPDPTDYRKAAERAIRSRHVPPAERAIVERYFRLLQEPPPERPR